MNELTAVIISSAFTLIGVIITCVSTSKITRDKVTNELHITQAISKVKIEELTREVREHNNFARRMPVVEEQIKVINHRIEDL